jgi:5'-nucleotidase
MKKIVGIDMDNTMFDFNSAFELAITKNPSIQYPQSQYGFFANLEPIPGAIDGYFQLKEKFHVKIVTRPSVWNPLCYTEKRVSVEKHLGFDECENLIEICDKTLFAGDYLIDDMPQEGLLDPSWGQIMFGSKEFPDWTSVLKYLM